MEFNRPANFKLIGNLNDNFKLGIIETRSKVYFTATETNLKSNEVQVTSFVIKCKNKVDKDQVHEVQINDNINEKEDVTYLTLSSIESEKHRNRTDTIVIENKKKTKNKIR